MKVLHYVDENKLAWGETWIQLIHELARQGVDNFVVCRPGGTLAGRLAQENLRYAAVKPLVQSLPFTCRAFGRVLDEFRPDLIHTRLSAAARIGGWWGKEKHLPVLQTIDKYAKLKYHINGTFYTACSTSVMDYFVSLGVPKSKIAVLFNAIDISRYSPDAQTRADMRAAQHVAADEKVVLAAGRFVDWKGFDVLIKGYERYLEKNTSPASRLWIVGAGEEKERLESLVAVSPFRERITIFPFARDIRKYMWAADLFVLPSKTPEPFGIVLVEAMACGLPAIATAAGGPKDIVADGSGWLVEPGSDAAIADQLTVLGDGELLTATAQRAAKRAEQFSVQSIAAETIGIYAKVIAEYHR